MLFFLILGSSINVGVALRLKGFAISWPSYCLRLFYCDTIVTLYHNKVNRQIALFLIFSYNIKKRQCLPPFLYFLYQILSSSHLKMYS